jgi:hypothetical protein
MVNIDESTNSHGIHGSTQIICVPLEITPSQPLAPDRKLVLSFIA